MRSPEGSLGGMASKKVEGAEEAPKKRVSGPSGKHVNPVLRISGVPPEERDAYYAHAESRGGFAAWARAALAETMRRERTREKK